MLKLFFTKKWLTYFLVTVISSIVCINLGLWQMDRRENLLKRIAPITNNYSKDPIDFYTARNIIENFTKSFEWTPIRLQGKYDISEQRIVRNRTNKSQVGYEILVPLKLANGDNIIVNRGWVPLGNNNSGYPDSVPQPSEEKVDVLVRIKGSEPSLHRTAPTGQIPSIDLIALNEELTYPIFTSSYGIMFSENPQPEISPYPLAKPSISEGSHLSYALQWFTFSIFCLFIFTYSLYKENKYLKSGSKTKTKKSTIEEEDKIIDSMLEI